jgi:hypothetical protein
VDIALEAEEHVQRLHRLISAMPRSAISNAVTSAGSGGKSTYPSASWPLKIMSLRNNVRSSRSRCSL